MLIPPQFRAQSSTDLVGVIDENPLSTLVTIADGALAATHCPMVTEAGWKSETIAGLRGATLLGHMNRINNHWQALVGGVASLAVFHGVGGYISPVVYERTPCSPTWDYVAVHVRGRIQQIPAGEETLEVVIRTVGHLETRFGHGWDMSSSLGYFRELSPGVGAFRMHVDSVEGIFKLSQDQSRVNQENVIAHLRNYDSASSANLADAIHRACNP